MQTEPHHKQPKFPPYAHHKSSGRAYVYWQGRRYYLGKFGSPKSRERYARFIAELAAAPSARTPAVLPAAQPDLTIVELCAAYWDFAKAYYVKNSCPTDHIWIIKRAIGVVRDLYATISAAEFGPRALRAVQAELVDRGYCRNTVNQTVGAVRRMFRWATSHELLPATVYQALCTVPGLRKGRSAARETKPVLPVENYVVEATLPYLPSVVTDMVRFQRLTGCRPREICQMRPCDVDRSGEVWTYTPAEHKTEHHGRQRIIYIGPKAQDVLRPYLLRPAEAFCFSPQDSEAKRREEKHAKRKTPLRWGNRPGTNRKRKPKKQPRDSYDKNSYRRAIARAVEKANAESVNRHVETGGNAEDAPTISHWHPNQLRHAAATDIRRAFGLEAAQIILGHAWADVTQVYAERDAQRAVEVVKRIG